MEFFPTSYLADVSSLSALGVPDTVLIVIQNTVLGNLPLIVSLPETIKQVTQYIKPIIGGNSKYIKRIFQLSLGITKTARS